MSFRAASNWKKGAVHDTVVAFLAEQRAAPPANHAEPRRRQAVRRRHRPRAPAAPQSDLTGGGVISGPKPAAMTKINARSETGDEARFLQRIQEGSVIVVDKL